MNIHILLQYATLVGVTSAAVSVVLAMVNHRRQINASIYLELTARFHHLNQTIPLSERAAFFAESPSTANEASRAAASDFFYLMAAGFTLHQGGYFSGVLWKALEAEAKLGLLSPLFRCQWPLLRNEFLSNPPFVRYVDRVQATYTKQL